MKIDWHNVWEELEDWLYSREEVRCQSCGHHEDNFPDWSDQQRKIEKLVEKRLRAASKR